MNTVSEYIIAICPEDEIVKKVAGLKQQLYTAIGWFGSYRSLAHITLDAFNADEEILQLRRELLKIFAAGQENYVLTFDSIAWFNESRTVYIAPDEASGLWLTALADSYSGLFYDKKLRSRFKPHLTIGRAIKQQYFIKATEVFLNQDVHISFLCNNIALRKFNYQLKQYDIVERYYFAGN